MANSVNYLVVALLYMSVYTKPIVFLFLKQLSLAVTSLTIRMSVFDKFCSSALPSDASSGGSHVQIYRQPTRNCLLVSVVLKTHLISSHLGKWQVISNDRFKSSVHRAVATKQGRYSIANLLYPPFDAVVEPAPELCTDIPPKFMTFKFQDFFDEFVKYPLSTGAQFMERYRLSDPTSKADAST